MVLRPVKGHSSVISKAWYTLHRDYMMCVYQLKIIPRHQLLSGMGSVAAGMKFHVLWVLHVCFVHCKHLKMGTLKKTE